MEQENVNGAGAGEPIVASSDAGVSGQGSSTPALGNQDVSATVDDQRTPSDQNGNTPDPREEELRRMREQNRALNRKLVEARRGSRQDQGSDLDQNIDLETESGRYAMALNVAENNLRGNLENIIPLYPELSSDMVARIRSNPWAFASRESYIKGDWKAALEDIEFAMLDAAESVKNNQAPTNPTTQRGGSQQPVQVNTNVPTSQEPGLPALPGSPEDTNPWTMPMDKLERVVMQEKAKASVQQRN